MKRYLLLYSLLCILMACNSSDNKVKDIMVKHISDRLPKESKLESLVVLHSNGISKKEYYEFKLNNELGLLADLNTYMPMDSINYKHTIERIASSKDLLASYIKGGSYEEIEDKKKQLLDDSLLLIEIKERTINFKRMLSDCQAQIKECKAHSDDKDTSSDYGYVARVSRKLVSSITNPLIDTGTYLISQNGDVEFIRHIK